MLGQHGDEQWSRVIARAEDRCDDRLLLSTTLDPDRRRVVLTQERWEHSKRRHPDLSGSAREIMAAVREPPVRRHGSAAGEELTFVDRRDRRGNRPWLQVVVHAKETRDG